MEPVPLRLLLAAFLLYMAGLDLVVSLQCYSCKSAGINEMDANIRCLEKAYLESCDEFYNYYNDVEEELYDYYYNFVGEDTSDIGVAGQEVDMLDEDGVPMVGDGRLNDDIRTFGSPANPANGVPQPKLYQPLQQNGYHPNDPRMQYPPRVVPARKKRQTGNNSENTTTSEESTDRSDRSNRNDSDNSDDYYDYYDDYSDEAEDSRDRHRGRGRGRSGRGHRGHGHRKGRNRGRGRKEDSEYDYEYYEDEMTTTTEATTTTEEQTTTQKPPAKPEHYCYSMTKKSGWETYTVEKGCKKIVYCKDSLVNKPEWAHPWNFCCDRSRCNVKLVKDKPQRVFGMGCRRTDDCIQGHNSRPVCPHFFKACPRISRSLVKMECRAQTRTMASLKVGLKYRTGKEKKCYCSKGYFPKGPICTSGVGGLAFSKMAAALLVLAPLRSLL